MSQSKIDLIAQVLEMSKKGSTRVGIASEIGVHQELADHWISLLTDLSLVAETHNSQTSFVTTERGHQFLRDYENVKKQVGTEERLSETR